MRIRIPFAVAFLLLLLVAGYAGFSTLQLGNYVNDKILHFGAFSLLTVVFYWIVDTNRRRTLNMTLVVCTLILGVGSEFAQSFLPNDRDFDLYDIVANVLGSLLCLGLCSWYHKRMLERRRQHKSYNVVPSEDDADVELGEGHGIGVTDGPTSLEEETDHWDENAVDVWDDDNTSEALSPPAINYKELDIADVGEARKRTD